MSGIDFLSTWLLFRRYDCNGFYGCEGLSLVLSTKSNGVGRGRTERDLIRPFERFLDGILILNTMSGISFVQFSDSFNQIATTTTHVYYFS